jgi:hypothetical protein
MERNPEGLTGTRQAGHDGSDRNLHDVSYLSIRQLLELAKHEQFTKTIRQVQHRSLDQGDVVVVEQQRFRILGDWTSPAVLFFIERIGRRVRAFPEPGPTCVAHNLEEQARPFPPVKVRK